MYRGLLLDFYGTLVAEDDALVAQIAEKVAAASTCGARAAQVATHWHQQFAELCAAAHGSAFRRQREIELESLADAARHHDADVAVAELAGELFAYWAAPAPLAGAAAFLRSYRGPICVVSNIDAAELQAAIAGLGWEFAHVVTSERCRAYKPRDEMFRTALDLLGCAPSEVLHVGDSIGSDVVGASRLGIEVAWVNAGERAFPESLGIRPRYTIRGVEELLPLLDER